MEPKAESKAARDGAVRLLRAKGPIAAQLEDCTQLLHRLSASLEACLPVSEKLYTSADDSLMKLILWGNEVGANSRALDHALRRSRQLNETTLENLSDLYIAVEKGIDELLPGYVNSTDIPENSHSVASLPTESDDTSKREDDSPEDDLQECLEEVEDIISGLIELRPSLHNPEDDWGIVDLGRQRRRETVRGIDIVVSMYPKTPPYLVERLSLSDERRRGWLKQMRSAAGSSGKQPRPPGMRRTSHAFMSLHRSRRAQSDAGISTVASTMMESMFSAGPRDATSTAFGTSIGQSVSAELGRVRNFQIPKPSVKLPSAELFTCPYCQYELPLSHDELTWAAWADHIYLDLEPYVCTFEHCTQPHKTFRLRGQWFQHEMMEHRVEQVWPCRDPTCMQEFPSEARFREHLHTSHGINISPEDDLALVISSLRDFSSQPSRSNACPFCSTPCVNNQDLEEHVGGHLEQFALSAIYYADSSEGEDEDSGANEMIGEDPAELILDRFVEDMELGDDGSTRNNSKVEMQAVWSKMIDENRKGHGAFRANTSDTSNSGVEEVGNGKSTNKKEGKQRVEAFLEHSTGKKSSESGESLEPTIISNLPPRDNEFVGRDRELGKIHAILSEPGQICVVNGRGGIGKTATAIEYAYRYQVTYSAVFWVEAETAGGCADKYTLIALNIGLGTREKHGEIALINFVKEYLTKAPRPWLLVFDNVESWADISAYIPRNMSKTRGSILVTSRQSSLLERPMKNYTEVALGVLTLEESTRLLMSSVDQEAQNQDWEKLRKHPEYSRAKKASELVGKLPLALNMIVGYLQGSSTSLGDFLMEWGERNPDDATAQYGAGTADSGGDMDPSINALWDIGISDLGEDARKLLNILALLDPEMIQKDFLVGEHKEPTLRFLHTSRKTGYTKTIQALVSRKLIGINVKEDGKEVYRIHRLLQQKIFGSLDSSKWDETFKRVFALVRKSFPEASPVQVPEPQKWAGREKAMAHIVNLHKIYHEGKSRMQPTLGLAQLFYDAGFHVWERQTTAYDGLSFMNTAEAMLDAIGFDQDAKLRADIHSIAGEFYNKGTLEAWKEAIRRAKSALAIRKKLFDKSPEPRDKDTDMLYHNALGDLAFIYLDLNKFEETLPMFDSCMSRYVIWGSEDDIPFEYAKYYLNNGIVMMLKGSMREAVKSLEKCVELGAKFSEEAWQYFWFKFNHACVLLQTGDYQGALDAHLETLNARMDRFGKHDESTISSTYAVGAMYHHLGELSKARDYLIECIECAKKIPFPEEALGRAQYHLGLVNQALGLDETEYKDLLSVGLEVLSKYAEYVSDRLVDEEPMVRLDDLQSTLEGRFTGVRLLTYLQDLSFKSDNGTDIEEPDTSFI